MRIRSMVGAALCASFLLVCGPTFAQDFRVTLLGTGSPNPSIERFGPATLVEAGPEKLLFDAGRGASIRLWQSRVSMGALTATFLSHFHSDHTVGLPDVWLTGWIQRPYGGRKTPFVVYGPKGTTAMMEALYRAYQPDIVIREADEHFPSNGVAIEAHDVEAGVIYEKNGVRVTAITVDHGDLIKPAFGFRIDYGGRGVVLSGDTRYWPPLAEAAKGAQLVIHEVSAVSPDLLARSSVVQAIFAHHTSPQDAGRIFKTIAPRLAVYSHLVPIGDAPTPAPTVDDIVRQTRETYAGPLAVGNDLMQFDVRTNGVSYREGKP